MSQDTSAPSAKDNYYLSAGVFKLDFRFAGYPDIKRITSEWAEDSNFTQIIIRKVSKNNLGIHFVYFTDNFDYSDKTTPIMKYKKQLQTQFGEGLYAWDVSESADSKLDIISADIVVNKVINLGKNE